MELNTMLYGLVAIISVANVSVSIYLLSRSILVKYKVQGLLIVWCLPLMGFLLLSLILLMINPGVSKHSKTRRFNTSSYDSAGD
jgi:uncharacterized membrane protein